MTFAFHAAPPPGEWFNDPTGLVFANGAWRLFVQHSAVGPAFGEIGWARLSSPDLLNWTWDGPFIAPDALGQAYSGSVVQGATDLTAYLTRHDGAEQRQVRLTSEDAGATWQHSETLGPKGRNVRDPSVFFCQATDDWRMLVAEPCDWTNWADDAPSALSIWRLAGEDWELAGRIGPWTEPGVMWEVPVLVDFGSCQALIISTVDRRGGRAECAVRYWLGQFDGTNFEAATAGDGLLLDHGPDFYAAIVNSPRCIGDDLMLVAWSSSWETARSMPWPDGVCGGPITLPRTLSLDAASGRLLQKPPPGIQPDISRRWDMAGPMEVTIAGDDASLELTFDARGLSVRRCGLDGMLNWERHDGADFKEPGTQTIRIFNDAGLIEVFVEPDGRTVTAFVPDARLNRS